MHGARFKWQAVPLMLLMLLLIFFSFNRTVSGFNNFLLGKHLDFWLEQPTAVTTQDLAKMDGYYQAAIAALEHDPALLQSGGHLSELMAINVAEDADKSQQYLNEALIRFRLSVNERPTWPYAWFDLARLKVGVSELDDEFLLALSNAVRLGPNERSLQIDVASLGLFTWEWLDSATQDIVWSAVNVAMSHNVKGLYEAVDNYGRLDLLCENESGNIWLDSKCTELRNTNIN